MNCIVIFLLLSLLLVKFHICKDSWNVYKDEDLTCKMAAVASQSISLSPSKLRDDSASPINNWQFYDQLKSEVQVLHNEVK
jgi:hypothetical protein